MTEWKPISTMPNDGGNVILARGGDVFEGWRFDDRFYEAGGDPVIPPPTHWMPLPPPPQETDA